MFLEVKKGDRVVDSNDTKKHGVCVRTLGMLVYVVWDGGTKVVVSTINAANINPENKE